MKRKRACGLALTPRREVGRQAGPSAVPGAPPADLADARRIDLASDPPDAGPVDVEGQLDLEGVPAGRYLEIVATLYAEGIATAAPTLRRLAVTYSCADPPE